ncbi:MAG: hypothetical protein ACFFBI_04780 [Promethearchaeota archaeon]
MRYCGRKKNPSEVVESYERGELSRDAAISRKAQWWLICRI